MDITHTATADLRAQLIASLITANCEAHLSGQKTRDAWSAEQTCLWTMAEKRHIALKVMAMVCPSLGGKR